MGHDSLLFAPQRITNVADRAAFDSLGYLRAVCLPCRLGIRLDGFYSRNLFRRRSGNLLDAIRHVCLSPRSIRLICTRTLGVPTTVTQGGLTNPNACLASLAGNIQLVRHGRRPPGILLFASDLSRLAVPVISDSGRDQRIYSATTSHVAHDCLLRRARGARVHRV